MSNKPKEGLGKEGNNESVKSEPKPAKQAQKKASPSGVAFKEGTHYHYYGPNVAFIKHGVYIQATSNQMNELPIPDHWIPEMKDATAIDLQDSGTAMYNVATKQDPHWSKYKAVENAVKEILNGG